MAPCSCAALRLLGGTPLLVLALRTLHNSGAVDRITVTCPAELEFPVARVLSSLPEDLPVTGPLVACCPDHLLVPDRPGRTHGHETLCLRTGAYQTQPIERSRNTAALLLVHDPLRAFVAAETVKTVVETLQQAPPECLAAVPVGPVTDTVKRVSGDSSVLSTEDRDRLRSVSSPVAYRILGTGTHGERAVLRSLLDAGTTAPTAPDTGLPGREPRGGRPRTAPGLVGTLVDLRPSRPFPDGWHTTELRGVTVSAQHEMRIASQDDLDLAEALLAVGHPQEVLQSSS